jgi:acetoin utilization deacetylase AcuC-like enzyme
MHSSRAFPVRKEQSDLDIGLDNGVGDVEYLRLLRQHLPTLLEDQPDIVLYDAGVDVHEHDMIHQFCRGGLALTSSGIEERDAFVIESCLSAGIPVATVIGGGYSDDIEELTRRHAIHARVAAALA